MIREIVAPQLGEGLQDVRIVRLLKREGDFVRRDEPIFEMETDKAQVQVESAYEGRIARWLAKEGDILAIGAPVVQVESAADEPERGAASPSPSIPPEEPRKGGSSMTPPGEPRKSNTLIPPRTRAHIRQLGISDDIARTIPAPSGKLMPADVDAWLSAQGQREATPSVIERPLPPRQRILVHRMRSRAQSIVPATLKRPVPHRWLEERHRRLREEHPMLPFSELDVWAFCLAKAARADARLRSTLIGDDTVREHAHLTLGVAVELADDTLATAVVTDADTLDFPKFAEVLQRQIARVQEGEDQAAAAPQVLLTFMGSHGITDAVPVLVAPAVAILFVGAPHEQGSERVSNLVFSFDHRLINGAGAARFLGALAAELDPAGTGRVVTTIDPARRDPALDAREAPRESSGPSSNHADRTSGFVRLGASLAAAVREAPVEARRALLEERLRALVADELGLAPSAVDTTRPLRTQGVSSAHAVALKARLEALLDLSLSVTLIWSYPTIERLAAHVAERMGVLLDRSPAVSRELVRGDARARATTTEPIAIIGIGCRFPGGVTGPDAFWDRLARGVDAIQEIPKDRWDIDAVYDPDPATPGRMCTRSGGFIEGIDRFDPGFFGVSRGEADGMDPQQRILLEVAYEAIEDAGIAPDRLAGSATGVFIGSCFNDYYKLLARPPARGGSGTLGSILANRISYFLGLTGPSMVVDSACSSSLVTVDLACRSLRSGVCQMALAGGVNIILSPEMHIAFSQARMMAPDGRCKTFDARANGYSRSEGCGIVVLKRLSDALAAGDRILAVIRGSAVNQDGATNGMTAPSTLAQQALITQALADAGVEAESVSLIEAHGTGTPLGDPIEVEALKAVYGRPREGARACVMGSVKTNIGHLEAAAGIAGLIKAVLCLSREAIPPHLHFTSLNPHISLDETRLTITTELRAWPRGDEPRFAGVSSFGVGGTNAHVILEEAPPPVENEEREPGDAGAVLALSARNEAALVELAARYAAQLDREPRVTLADVCHTANTGRAHLSCRRAIVARSLEELRARIGEIVSGGKEALGKRRVVTKPRVGFAFPGAPAELAAAGDRLRVIHPACRAALDACSSAFAPYLGSGLAELRGAAARFSAAYALASLWRAWGVEPAVVKGEGEGETVAACVKGALSLDEAAALLAGARPGPAGAAEVAGEAVDIALVFASEGSAGGASLGISATRGVFPGCPPPGEAGWLTLLETVAALYESGASIDWAALDPRVRRRVALPTYPFQRVRCWLPPDEMRTWQEAMGTR